MTTFCNEGRWAWLEGNKGVMWRYGCCVGKAWVANPTIILTFFFFWFAYHSIQGFAPTNLLVDPRRTPGLVGESPNGDFLHTQALEPESPSNLLKRYQAAYHLKFGITLTWISWKNFITQKIKIKIKKKTFNEREIIPAMWEWWWSQRKLKFGLLCFAATLAKFCN